MGALFEAIKRNGKGGGCKDAVPGRIESPLTFECRQGSPPTFKNHKIWEKEK